MKLPEPPDGFLLVPPPKAYPLLTARESVSGMRRETMERHTVTETGHATFVTEVKRLIREYVPTDPPADRLAHTLVWVLYARGDLKKRRRRSHGETAWRQRQRPFYGGAYGPRTR